MIKSCVLLYLRLNQFMPIVVICKNICGNIPRVSPAIFAAIFFDVTACRRLASSKEGFEQDFSVDARAGLQAGHQYGSKSLNAKPVQGREKGGRRFVAIYQESHGHVPAHYPPFHVWQYAGCHKSPSTAAQASPSNTIKAAGTDRLGRSQGTFGPPHLPSFACRTLPSLATPVAVVPMLKCRANTWDTGR